MHVRRLTQADLPEFARVTGLSMWDDEIMAYTSPHKNQHPDSFFRFCLLRTKLRYYRGEELFVCVTDKEDTDWNGKEVVAGYCGYSTTVNSIEKPQPKGWLGNAFEQWAIKTSGKYANIFHLDRSSNPNALAHFRSMAESPAFEQYLASLSEGQKEKMGDQHWELEVLGTHPDFRRRGVGKLMLEEGKKRARENGVPLLVISSIMGEHLYLSAGFREVNRIQMLPQDEHAHSVLKDLDLGIGKGKGLAWAAMVWEPESLRASAMT